MTTINVEIIKQRKRVCCNCGNNERVKEPHGIECYCSIDGHRIGYVECFEHWCRRWKKNRKWDNINTETT